MASNNTDYTHIEKQIQGYSDMQSLAYDEIDVHTLLGQVIDTMTDMLAVVRAAKELQRSMKIQRATKGRRYIELCAALAKLEQQ